MSDKVVLGFSGGLETSTAVIWLKEKYGLDVVTVTLKIGQKEDFEEIEYKSKQLGAIAHYTIDAIDEFANEYIARAIKANGLYEDKYPLSTALARPLIAKKLVEIAEKENAKYVAHGCTGKGNDQIRFDVTMKALNPYLKIIAPVREWNMNRDEEMQYLKSKGIDFKFSRSKISVDENLWGRSIEGDILEDPSKEPLEEYFEWVTIPEKTPDKSYYLTLEFEKGIPVALNGEEMKLSELIALLNNIAGKHGVGIIDHIEDRVVGFKSREVYECPAAVCILEAHKELEKLILNRNQLFFKRIVDFEWSWLVYSGLWMDPLRNDLEAFINSTQELVSGKVTLKLYKGNYRVVSRTSPNSNYNVDIASYFKSNFDQKLAIGFIEYWGLPTILSNRIKND
jgi:argininosuccinate synthase